MYLEYFELSEAPFSITPDPRFVYLTDQHRDALAHLLFGINQGGGGGFVQLTGEVGTGKTTLCRLLLAQLPENVRVALVLNPMQQPVELLHTICDELRVPVSAETASIKELTDALTTYLLASYAAGLRVVVILDEAQNLSFDALEQIRLLTNLETPTQKLLQIVLLGQPELRDLLARSELRQLAQRITARFHLAPLSDADTAAYVAHRLAVAGRRRPLFTLAAIQELFRRTRGYPRAINVLCDRALLGGYARDRPEIDAPMIRLADQEIRGSHPARARRTAMRVAAVALLACTAFGAWWMLRRDESASVIDAAVTTATTPVQPALASIERIRGFDEISAGLDVVAKTWSADAAIGSARCAAAEATLCARLRMNMALLAELDRPGVLELRLASTRKLIVLRGLDATRARIAGAQRLAVVDRAAIEAAWFGDLWIAAPRPSGYLGETIAPGASGEIVVFIHTALAHHDGQASGTAIYDADSAARVRVLQDRYGLVADGLVGPETMALLVALTREGPRLGELFDSSAFVSHPQQ